MSPPSPPPQPERPPNAFEAFLRTETLTSSHDVSGFDSGEPALDTFLTRFALPNQAGVSQTAVMLRRDDDPPELPLVLGFRSLAMATVPAELVAPHLSETRLPRYPLGVVLLARLAVDRRARGRGFGELLLFDAFAHVLLALEHLGGVGLVTDPKHQAAEEFYARYGFVRLTSDSRRLFLPISTIRRTLHSA